MGYLSVSTEEHGFEGGDWRGGRVEGENKRRLVIYTYVERE